MFYALNYECLLYYRALFLGIISSLGPIKRVVVHNNLLQQNFIGYMLRLYIKFRRSNNIFYGVQYMKDPRSPIRMVTPQRVSHPDTQELVAEAASEGYYRSIKGAGIRDSAPLQVL